MGMDIILQKEVSNLARSQKGMAVKKFGKLSHLLITGAWIGDWHRSDVHKRMREDLSARVWQVILRQVIRRRRLPRQQ